MILNIFFIFQNFFKFLIKNAHSDRKYENILIKIFICLLIFCVIQFLNIIMVLFGIKIESLNTGKGFIVLASVVIRISLVKSLSVSKH